MSTSTDEKTLYVHMTAPKLWSVFLGIAVSTIIVFNWGYMAWMVFGLHDGTIESIPSDTELAKFLDGNKMESGVYAYPAMPDMKSKAEQQGMTAKQLQTLFEQQHEAGPIFTIIYKAKGGKPMPGSMMGGGFLIQFLASCIAGFLLYMTAGSAVHYWQRVAIVFLIALFGMLISHVALWNWMYYPTGYTFAMVLDPLVGWFLAGLAMAAIIKPRILREGTEPVR